MISRVKSFVKNHWKKAVVGGILFQGTRYALSYASNQIAGYQEQKAKELWKRVKKSQHFESMDSNCITTFLSILPTLKESISSTLDSQSLLESLKTPISNKVQVWEELKILAFSRVITAIYGSSLLFTLLRVQLSILGGYLFIESTTNDSRTPHFSFHQSDGIILSDASPINPDLQQKYLALANYLTKDGLKRIGEIVYACTRAAIGDLPLKQKLTISDLEQIIWGIIGRIRKEDVHTEDQERMLKDPIRHSPLYIFSPAMLESYNNFSDLTQLSNAHYEPPDMYKRLMFETFDILDSDEYFGLLKAFEMQGISHFLDRLADIVNEMTAQNVQTPEPASNSSSSTTMVNGDGGSGSDSMNTSMEEVPSISTPPMNQSQVFEEVSLPMARLIPLINGLSEKFMTEGDQWSQLLTKSDGAKTFGANIYESFSIPVVY